MTQKKKKLSFEEEIKELGYVPHDSILETVVIDRKNVKRRENEVEKVVGFLVKFYEEKANGRVIKKDIKLFKEQVLKNISSSGYDYVLLKDRKKEIGFVEVNRSKVSPIGNINIIYVSPEHRRKYMGKKLERKSIYHLLKKEGVKEITGHPANTSTRMLAKFREEFMKKHEKGEFKDALKRWKLGKKAKKKRKRRK